MHPSHPPLDGIRRVTPELPGPRARAIIERSRRYEPRSASDQVPVVWARAQRVYIEDADGNVFLDFSSGVLVANAGHSHPALVAEMMEQAGRAVNTYDFLNEFRPALAEKLVAITPPNLDRAIIFTTGAEAVEAAIKMARKFTGRHEIIAFHGGFHGRTYGAMSVGGKRSGAGTRGFGPFLPGVVLAPFPYCYRCPFEKRPADCGLTCLHYLGQVYDMETEHDVAAVVVESYQGAAGSIIPPVEYMQVLAAWCRERDILLIADEVQASFGRTGKLFGFEHYDITPNLLCLGKGISSSVPVSAVVGEHRIMDVLTPGSISSTHGGNAFCTRVALRNIEVILEEGLAERAARLEPLFRQRFEAMARRHPQLGDVRGMGMVWGLEFVTDPESRRPDPALARRVVEGAFERGLVLIAPIGTYANVIRVAPPLVITEDEAEAGLRIMAEALEAAVQRA